jgi:hypothetical protein
VFDYGGSGEEEETLGLIFQDFKNTVVMVVLVKLRKHVIDVHSNKEPFLIAKMFVDIGANS